VDKIIQGNAQPLTSHIATPTGWKLMRDIQVGDEVLTPKGTVTTVTGVYPKGKRPVYDVELCDGSHAEACNEHLWDIIAKEDDESINSVVTTDTLKSYIYNDIRVSLSNVEPLAYKQKCLVLNPFILGFILSSRYDLSTGIFDFSDVDKTLKTEFYKLGYNVNQQMDLHAELSDLGLLGIAETDKFIPNDYIFGSIEQRKQLLFGLCDSFGYFDSSYLVFIVSGERLSKDIQSLIRSLGGVCFVKKQGSMFKIRGKVNFLPFGCDCMKHILRLDNSRWDLPLKYVRKVTYLRDDEVQCISVADESHMYITDDYIPTHNTSNIVFLKSTDDSMLDTLQKMSGTTHRSYTDSKTITRDKQRIFMQNESKVSYTMTTKEVPVISYNDMAFISPSNSIIFRAGDAPIWNRNETVLPMSWRLFTNTIVHAGHEYSLQTIPTLSSALDFDVRKNQPDFTQMLNKRMEQAIISVKAKTAYQTAYGYSDYQMSQLDPDVLSDDIMSIINAYLRKKNEEENDNEDTGFDYNNQGDWMADMMDNPEVQAEADAAKQRKDAHERKKFAQGKISPADLTSVAGQANHSLDKDIITVFVDAIGAFRQDTENFRFNNGDLYSADGRTLYIQNTSNSDDLKILNQAAKDASTGVYADSNIEQHASYQVTDEFIRFLASRDRWDFANGKFEILMSNRIEN
jgi:conserved hypothetical protein